MRNSNIILKNSTQWDLLKVDRKGREISPKGELDEENKGKYRINKNISYMYKGCPSPSSEPSCCSKEPVIFMKKLSLFSFLADPPPFSPN